MVNRTRTQNELNRRYDEVQGLASKGMADDKQTTRLHTAIAHYVNYAKNNKLTKAAIDSLFSDKSVKRKDKVLCKEADEIIGQMKSDRDEIVKIAKSKGVDIDAYKFQVGAGEIKGNQEFSFYLNHLDEFLNLPSDAQSISELPGNILYLTQLTIDLVNNFGANKRLEQIKSESLAKRNAFEEKLKIHGVHLDYLRFEDYKHLNWAWMEVYRQGDGDELLLFHLEYGHLFQGSITYSGGQRAEADRFADDYLSYMSRFHNHLIDHIEDVPLREEFAVWFIEHFGPTLVSVLLIALVLIVVNWITGGNVTYDDVNKLLP